MNNLNVENMHKFNDDYRNIKNLNYMELYTKTKPYLNYDVFINVLGIYLLISFIDFWLFFRVGLLYYIYKYKTNNNQMNPIKFMPTIKLSTIIKNLEDSSELSSTSMRCTSITTSSTS